jgi:O-antigen/teichoic acid export membrane protein
LSDKSPPALDAVRGRIVASLKVQPPGGAGMSVVTRNIISNIVGGGLLAVLTIVITPLQVRLLGLEAFGVIGLIAALQIIFTAFDFGLANTVTREIAADHSTDKVSSRPLLQSVSTVFWVLAMVTCAVVVSFSDSLASRWLKSLGLSSTEMANSITVVALYLALRWPVALYTGVLTGLQRMDLLNLLKVLNGLVRLGGGCLVLFIHKSLYIYLLWTLISALVEVVSYWLCTRRVFPSLPMRPKITLSALSPVLRFALGMNGLSILTVVIVQADRLLISKMLSLFELGAYSLAHSTSFITASFISAIGAALLPAYSSSFGKGGQPNMIVEYENASRFLLYSSGLIVFPFIFQGQIILDLWVGEPAATAASLPLALLSVGFWGSAIVSNAFQLAIASGSPGPVLRISFLSAPIYLLVLYGAIAKFGIVGAASAWAILNMGYVIAIVPLVHRNYLRSPAAPFFLRIAGPYTLIGLIFFGGTRLLSDILTLGQTPPVLLMASAGFCYVIAGFFLLAPDSRQKLLSPLRRWFAHRSEGKSSH